MCGIDEKRREREKKKKTIIITLITNNVPGLKSTGESSNELGVQAFQFLALKERKKNLYYIIQVSLLLMPRKILQIKIQFMKITLKKYTEGCQQTNEMIYWNNGTHRGELKMEK